jgi:hypothetical protein
MSGMQILGGLTQVIGMGATIGSVVENKVASTVIGAGAGLMAMGPIGGLIGGGIALLSAFNASSQRKQAASEAQRAIKEQLTDLTEHISQIEATAPRRFQLAADQLSRDWARTRNVAAINEQRIAEDRARATLQFGVIMSDLDKDVSMRERDVATQTRSRIGEAAVGYASSGFAEGGSSYFNVSAIEQEGQTAKDRIRLARSREEWRAKFNYDIEMELSKRARENLGLQMEMAKSEYEFNKLKLGMDAEDLAWEVARAKRKGRRLADEYERQGNIARSKSIGALGSLISSTLGQEDRMRELPGQILRTALSM